MSLFGLDSIDAVKQEVKKQWLEKAGEISQEGGKTLSKAADGCKKLFETVKGILPESLQKGGETISCILDLVNYIPVTNTMYEKKVILVFDDLERSRISSTDILGCINDYCENQHFNVIIVANEDKIGRNASGEECSSETKNSETNNRVVSDSVLNYDEIKEKIVQRVIPFTPDYTEVIDNSIESLTDSIEYKGFLRRNKEMLMKILAGDFDDSAIIVNFQKDHYKLSDNKTAYDEEESKLRKLLAQRPHNIRKGTFTSLNQKVKDANFRSQFLSGLMQPLMTFVGNLGYVAVCVVGASQIINGNITFGVITAFLIYIRLFESPLRQISQAMTQVQSCAAASERVFEFLAEEEMEDESAKTKHIDHVRGEVEFKNVKFAYPSAPEKEIIHDFSVKVKPGQKAAIVGPTGAGKTTLVNLLMRFYELTGGEILIDGVPMTDIPRENVHSQFGMVLQDTWLFEGTVRENLLYNTEGVTEAQMIEACKACGIHNFISALPHGYDSVLSDNTAISAGQKQLMTIARAMLQNSPMLILDEATSSVDTKTEMITQQAMDKLTDKRTSFVIAHRLSTIKNADIILVMRDGDIVEQGSHEELLAQNGFYAELYNSQFEQAS